MIDDLMLIVAIIYYIINSCSPFFNDETDITSIFLSISECRNTVSGSCDGCIVLVLSSLISYHICRTNYCTD
jgi:hypothetical protein